MLNNRELTISTAGSRKATYWPPSRLLWSEFCDRLRTPVRSTETIDEYLKLPKQRQDELKDVGGFVGGTLNGNRRKAANITGRDLVTLDLDNLPSGQTEDILRRVDGLGCAAAVYSTRKHTGYAPRLRIIIPLDTTAATDEYEPIARKLAGTIGIEYCDPTTFEASRMMYWPSVSVGAPYVCEVYDKPFCSKDGLLALYEDWKDVSTWPQVPGIEAIDRRRLAKQEDPTAKKGIVGAFCRTYSITQAMDAFIPGIYEQTDIPGRYTYTGGSTTGGAVLYDGDLFLFSHHATDPCSGQLVNAWDMVRLHKFGDRDDEALPGTPVHRLPSYAAMSQLVLSDKTVTALIAQERFTDAKDTFAEAPEVTHTDWMQQLAISQNGNYEKTINNIILILEHDERLAGKFATDVFAGCGLVLGALPWNSEAKRRRWSDSDDAGLRWYFERTYNITAKEKIYDGLSIVGSRKKINVVKDYLQGLVWDGTKRLDTVMIDYLGAEDSEYVRAATRKVLVAACARAVREGVKFDYMPIIIGRQGIGKSTLLATLGKEWFSDSLTTFEGKDAAEMIQGTWINEIGELTAMSHHETNSVKQFLSKTHDIYRAAYGRRTEEYARRCVFIGTSNHNDVLKDKTGNRRFWPIDTMVHPPVKSVWDDLPDEVDQIWAEAYTRFILGEKLYLSGVEAAQAYKEQEKHEEYDEMAGEITAFLEKEIPDSWDLLDLQTRRTFLSGGNALEVDLVRRDKVCAKEIYHECLGKNGGDTDRRVIMRINAILRRLPGWEPMKTPGRFGPYGTQRGYRRIDAE